MLDSVTIYGLATLGTGVLGLAIRYCFRSKCSTVEIGWGCFKIIRATDDEVRAEEMELKNKQPPSPTSPTNQSIKISKIPPFRRESIESRESIL